ncbi:MAG: UPF0175 family protein [Phycisphaerales bacterium]|nr:UPF0175 family protein [Phycisphaerales bacterium]
MSLNIDIPGDIERILTQRGQDAAVEFKEAAMVELFRQGRIDHSQFAAALGLSRDGADGVLKRHGVMLATNVEQVLADAQALGGLGRP